MGKVWDWLAQPAVFGEGGPHDAEIIKAYWEGIAKKDEAQRPVKSFCCPGYIKSPLP